MTIDEAVRAIDELRRRLGPTNDPRVKDRLARDVQEAFQLTHARSVYYRADLAIRFCWHANEGAFSNTVISLRTLAKYDDRPFLVCIVTPTGLSWRLANSTFVARISHSSKLLSRDLIRGSINGPNIVRQYNGIENTALNFSSLYTLHEQATWDDNLDRIVEATDGIVGKTRVEFSPDQREAIRGSPRLVDELISSTEFSDLQRKWAARVQDQLPALLSAAADPNAKTRGEAMERAISGAGAVDHDLADLREMIGRRAVLIDIKSKLASVASLPKAYNIDKMLAAAARRESLFLLIVVVDVVRRTVRSELVSVLDSYLIAQTNVQHHWSGRESRGVTQFKREYWKVVEPGFRTRIDVDDASQFLVRLLDL